MARLRRGDIVALPEGRVFAHAVVAQSDDLTDLTRTITVCPISTRPLRDRSSLIAMLMRLSLPTGISGRSPRPAEVLIDKPLTLPTRMVKATAKSLDAEQLFYLELGLVLLLHLYDPQFLLKTQ